MRVILFGEFSPGSVANSCLRVFHSENIEVKTIDSRAYHPSLFNRLINKFRTVPIFFGTKQLNELILSATNNFKPDLILFIKPIFILSSTLEKLKGGPLLFSWYPDYLPYPKTSSTDFMKSIPLYDCHFSFGSENAKEFPRFGSKKTIFLPFAADLECHHPVALTPEEKIKLGCDLIFIGTYDDDYRLEFLERLCQAGYNLKIYGNGWGSIDKGYSLYKSGAIQFLAPSCLEMAKAMCASKIALGFLREHNKDMQTMRTYEIPACGVFMLHKRTNEVAELFLEGEEAEYFESYDEMVAKIDIYLLDDKRREEVAKRGYQKVINADYTYSNRIKDIINIYNEFKK